ncbi:MAG: hypothetical protein ACOYYF_07475 [Chloroflexota bacterium]|nr:hypothetical protein [Chloroflexota bacterium]MBI5704047.1 hypothetical protein [Chloroflexota bacterium]
MGTFIKEFLDAIYIPNHDPIPGYLGIGCLIMEFGIREQKCGYDFQYKSDTGELFFVCPTFGSNFVYLPIGIAENVDDAIEQAKQFLVKWLTGEPQYWTFQQETHAKIMQLEEEQRQKKGKR